MKKNILLLLLILILIFSLGCGIDQEEQPEPTDPIENESPIIEVPEEPSEHENNQDPTELEELSVEDFYPLESNMEYIYTGEGNEYASYNVLVDYIDQKSNKIQTRTNNDATEMVKVLEIGDKDISLHYSKEETYHRDNLLKIKPSKNNNEILLKEPIKEGTQWTLPDKRVRTITNTSVE